MPELLDELIDWLRIPSVSTGGGDHRELRRAASWAAERIEAAGGSAALVERGGNPLVVGELPASHGSGPTVLSYGHYDVQDPGPAEAWVSPPFEPAVRDGRLYARGAADDKGNFLPLLHTACELARAGELPVNVRFLIEGEEEVGSASALGWLQDDERGADCALVFDSLMFDERTPALTTGTRGMVAARVSVRTGQRDLHSGLHGGAAPNAAHVLCAMLAAVTPGADRRLPGELGAGVERPTDEERAAWAGLPGHDREARERTWAHPSLDVNMLAAGAPRTIVPAEATAFVSVRLAPGQRAATVGAELERLLRAAAPREAEVSVSMELADPALFDPAAPALRLAAEALERAAGVRPALVRMGGTIPLLAVLAERGIPTAVSGFVLEDDAIHAPNESFRLESLRLGERAARELYLALARLESAPGG